MWRQKDVYVYIICIIHVEYQVPGVLFSIEKEKYVYGKRIIARVYVLNV